MAAGEYISVSSQRDTEQADIDKERIALSSGPAVREMELNELIQIYIDRGLDEGLARQVAVKLTEKDAVRAHARVSDSAPHLWHDGLLATPSHVKVSHQPKYSQLHSILASVAKRKVRNQCIPVIQQCRYHLNMGTIALSMSQRINSKRKSTSTANRRYLVLPPRVCVGWRHSLHQFFKQPLVHP